MLSPAIAMMMARAWEAELRREAERFSKSGGNHGIHRRWRDCGVAVSPSTRRLLVSRSRELISFADSLGHKRDELVRMIQRLPSKTAR